MLKMRYHIVMKRSWLILLSILFLFATNRAFAVEFKPLEKPKAPEVEATPLPVEKKEIETPKALLNDDEYQLNGRVEYDKDGVLFLDDDVKRMQLKLKDPVKKVAKKSIMNDTKVLTDIQEEQHRLSPQVNEYSISPTFSSLEYKIGSFTYGTTFGTDMDIGQLEYRTKMFVQYDNKYVGMMAGFGKDQYTSTSRQLESIYLTPSWNLGHGFVIKDAFKANPSAERHRNEIVLQYSPLINKSRENVQLEAALGQTTYYNSGEQIYQFSLFTKFKL